MSSRFLAVAAAASVLAAACAHAAASAHAQEGRHFRTLSVGLSGGFQSWSLDGLEQSLTDRAAQFAQLGYHLGPGDFGITYSYGLELQVRLTELLFLRSEADWTRLRWEDRDRESIAQLGSSSRDGFSVDYVNRVKTRPMLFVLGAGLARELTSLRFGLSGNVVIAPVELEDTVTITRELSESTTQVTSTGTGAGFETDLSVDWFTDVRTNLFVDVFWRTGSTTVELDDPAWESSLFPGKHRIDFDGAGIRLGFRWI